ERDEMIGDHGVRDVARRAEAALLEPGGEAAQIVAVGLQRVLRAPTLDLQVVDEALDRLVHGALRCWMKVPWPADGVGRAPRGLPAARGCRDREPARPRGPGRRAGAPARRGAAAPRRTARAAAARCGVRGPRSRATAAAPDA